MPAVPQQFNYEIHHTAAKFSLVAVAMALASEREKALFLKAAEHAGNRTGGPLMKDGGVACAHPADLEDSYWDSISKGVSPCYVDQRDGYVYMGDWVFVPTKRPILVPDDDERFGKGKG